MAYNRRGYSFLTTFDIFFEAAQFSILTFLCVSGIISYSSIFIDVFLFIIIGMLIQKFWRDLLYITKSNLIVFLIFLICIAVLIIIFLIWGYLPISNLQMKLAKWPYFG